MKPSTNLMAMILVTQEDLEMPHLKKKEKSTLNNTEKRNHFA